MAAAAIGLALAEAPAGLDLGAAGLLAALLSAGDCPGGRSARALTAAPRLALLAAAALMVGSLAGQARLQAIDGPAARARPGDHVEGLAHLLEKPRPAPFGARVDIRMTSGRARGTRLRALLDRDARLPVDAGPGLELGVSGGMKAPRPPQPGGFDLAGYLRRRGIAGELEVDRLRLTGRRRGGLAGVMDSARRRAERSIGSGLGPADAALARGMVLGQDEAIDPAVVEDFRASGLAHVLAVSGQNVMLLAALALPLLAASGLPPPARIALTVILIGAYVPLAGAGPSLQRAGVMGAASLVALAASRPASRWYALLLAACVTLILNPRAWGDPGWQLSFAAVAGILVMAPPVRAALAPLPRVLAEGIALTVAATVATLPLLAHHFGLLSLASLPANVAALPLVAPIMWLGMLRGGLGALVALGAGRTAALVGDLLGAALEPLLRGLSALATTFAEMPGAQIAVPLASKAGVALAYVALAAGAAVVAWLTRRTETGRTVLAASWRRLPRARRIGAVVASALVVGLVFARATSAPPLPDRLTVSFLDVGQGDATLVQHPDGGAVLFDGGPPEGRVARLLRRTGVRRLSAVVMTHASRDHHGGLAEVVERFPVELLVDGGDGTTDRAFRAVVAAAERHGARRVALTAPATLRAGGLTIRVLSPPPRPPGRPPEDPNPRALVAVVSAGELDLLLSADAESPSLEPLALPDVDAMKVPHHGSADAGLPAVLERLRPELAVAEVGQDNTYGHPTPSTLAALRAGGATTYRTDLNGTVTLTVERGEMRVEAERGGPFARAP